MAMDLKWMLSADDKATPVFDKVQASGRQLADGIDGAFGKLKSSFDGLTGLVGGLIGIAAGGAMAAVIKTTVDWDLSVAKLSNTMGITLESASIFSVAMRTLGIDQDTATSAAMKLAKSVSTNPQLFKDLGVAVTDSSGHYRDSMSVMMDVNAKLSEQKGGLDRNAIAMQIYGRSWAEIQPLLKYTQSAMEEAKVTAERLHLIVGPEGVAQSKEYKKGLNELGLIGTSLAVQFGSVLLPKFVAFGSLLSSMAPYIASGFGYLLTFVQKSFTTIGEWIGLMGFRFYSLGAIIWDALHGNFDAVKQDFAAMVAAGIDFSDRTATSWTTGWKAPKQALQEVKGKQDEVTTSTADYSKQLKDVVSQVDKYTATIKNAGKEEIELAKNGLTDDLSRQNELLKENGQIWGDMQAPVIKYLSVVDNVTTTQKQMIADTRTALLSLINSDSGKMSTGGKDSKITLADDLKKELQKLKLAELEIEKNSLTEKYKAWESYYKSLKTLVMDKDKELNAAHQVLMDDRLMMDKAFKDLNAKPVDDSKDQVSKYFDQISSWKSRMADAANSGDADQARKNIAGIKDEILAFQKANPGGIFADMTKEVRTFSDGMGVFDRSETKTEMVNYKDIVISVDQELSDLNDVMKLAGTALEDLGQKKIKDLNNELFDAQVELEASKLKIDDVRGALKLLDIQITEQQRVVTMSLDDHATAGLRNIKSVLDDLVSKKYVINIGTADNYGGNVGKSTITVSGGNGGQIDFGDYYTQGGNTFWKDGTFADNGIGFVAPQLATGTNYVPRDMLAYIHKGEAVVPAKYNTENASGITIAEGGIQITVQGSNSPSATVDELARKLVPMLDTFARRRRVS